MPVLACKFGNEAGGILPNMLVILGSLFLPFASRMASQAKEVEMLSTEELQRNQQLISQIYRYVRAILFVKITPTGLFIEIYTTRLSTRKRAAVG
jgi:hypothetical protein